jgi:hypothetical protein
VPRTVIIEREPPVYIQRNPVVVNPQPSAPPAPDGGSPDRGPYGPSST